MSLTQIGVSGLLASQQSLNITSNNIANAETKGYNRQTTYYVPTYTLYPGVGSVGTGVHTGSVERITNSFLTAQLWESQSWQAETNTYASYLNELDQWLGSDSTALGGGFENFFTAVNGASVDPFSPAARQVVLSESQGLVRQFNTLYDQIEAQGELLGNQLSATTATANSLLANIAGFNNQLRTLSAGDQPANELLDQRELAILELSELLGVNVLDQPDGTVNIYLKSGQPLLLSDQPSQINVSGSVGSVDGFELSLSVGQNTLALNGNPGGSIGGMMNYQSTVLKQAQNELGRLAMVMSDSINQQLQVGEDIDGNAGVNLFQDLNTPANAVYPLTPTSAGISSLQITDSSQLKASEYDFKVDNAGNYTVTRRSDGVQVDSGLLSGGGTDTLTFDGVSIDVDGTAVDQSYRLAPTRYGARDMAVVMSDPLQLAFAEAGKGPGDNSNLLQIIDLQSASVVDGSKSLTEAYTQFVGDIAVQTSQAKTEATGGINLLNQAESAVSSFSGVNMDEEAANLLRFQQLYSANAQVISVARSTFDSLLRMF